MVAYPLLTAEQQSNLPRLTEPAKAVPSLFNDSTHQIWRCQTTDGPMILKVCQQENVEDSPFWQGVNTLFDIGFPANLGNMTQIYQYLTGKSTLMIPEPVASGYAASSGFVLSRLLSGDALTVSSITDHTIKVLAEHISHLHSDQLMMWGELPLPSLMVDDWPIRLKKTLHHLADILPDIIADEVLAEAIADVASIKVTSFVPIMIDLRWDQFLHQDGQLTALIDLDALVVGPVELEWVLLEYLLDSNQALTFVKHYTKSHAVPDLTDVRTPYRLLLFMMNVFGETDIDVWMRYPQRF